MNDLWPWLLGCAAVCYGFKLAGMSVPDKVLRHPRVSLVADLLPIALLSALVAVQVLATDQSVTPDARLVGLGAPFLVVVVVAAASAALVRLL